MQKEAFENKVLQFGTTTTITDVFDYFETIYKGYFLNGERHGPGVETSKYETLECEFKNGQKNGRGKFDNMDGSDFYSEYKDDKKHGFE